MSGFVKVADAGSLAPGHARTVEVGTHSLALVNLAGDIHALENICPHAGGPLGDGILEGEWLRCPWHGWGFSVPTGRCEFNGHIRQQRFPVRVDGDGVWVDLQHPLAAPDGGHPSSAS